MKLGEGIPRTIGPIALGVSDGVNLASRSLAPSFDLENTMGLQIPFSDFMRYGGPVGRAFADRVSPPSRLALKALASHIPDHEVTVGSRPIRSAVRED